MEREMQVAMNDAAALALMASGRLRVEPETGLVFASESKTPHKAIGAANARGYLRACITTKGRRTMLMVHRVVWLWVHGSPAPGLQINHRDGNKINNAISNLELVSAAQNNAHARATGLFRAVSGLQNGYAKLSQEQVLAARSMKAAGGRTAEIAQQMGVSEGYMRRLLAGTARS